MDDHHLRVTLLKVNDRLSDEHRQRLHFYLGNVVPRRIRDDKSHTGTLDLMESLLDQDKINEQDFTFLINAFKEIQCIEAVKLLQDHVRQVQPNRLNQSVPGSTLITPPTLDQLLEDQEADAYPMQNITLNQQNNYDNNNMMIDIDDTNINPVTADVRNQTTFHSRLEQKQRFKKLLMALKCLSPFTRKLIIVLGVLAIILLIYLCVVSNQRTSRLQNELKWKDKIIADLQAKSAQSFRTIQQLMGQLKDGERVPKLLIGTTVAGNKDGVPGKGARGLNTPPGIYVSPLDGALYVSDALNYRAQRFELGSRVGVTVAEGNGCCSNLKQTNKIWDIFVDHARNVYIGDRNNHRAVCWPPTAKQGTIVTNGPVYGVTFDRDGNLYTSLYDAHVVLRNNSTVVAGTYQMLGPNATLLNSLRGLFFDKNISSLFVCGASNHRILKFQMNSSVGITVAGGNEKGSGAHQLNEPSSVWVSSKTNFIYIADTANHRVQRWKLNTTEGVTIVDTGTPGADQRCSTYPSVWLSALTKYFSMLSILSIIEYSVSLF